MIDLSYPSVAENLALDEALLIEADLGRGERVLRFWEAADYAVVMGASCRLNDDVRVDQCRGDGVPILRRTSGGGTVVVGPGALNVSLILPDSEAPGLAAVDRAHRYVLDWIASAINRAGVCVTLEGQGDLVLEGRKCGGSAQRRLRRWFMVHCSILYDFAIDRITRYLDTPRRQPEYRQGRAHHDFLRNLDLPRTILVDSIGGTQTQTQTHTLVGGSAAAAAVAAAVPLVATLLSEKFANRAWIERF